MYKLSSELYKQLRLASDWIVHSIMHLCMHDNKHSHSNEECCNVQHELM